VFTYSDLFPGSIPAGGVEDRRRMWYVFRAFNLYRLVLAVLLLSVFVLDEDSSLFGQTHPRLFQWTVTGYVGIVLLAVVSSYWRRPALIVQAHIQALVDLVGLSLLIYSSGGIASNLSVLLIIAIAASGILLPLYSALLAAASGFFLMFGLWLEQVVRATESQPRPLAEDAHWFAALVDYLQPHDNDLERLGVLGASFFIAAVLTYTLAERSRRSEALVRQRTQELLEMAKLNQAIVQHLQSGVIVVDPQSRIRLINDTACELLNCYDFNPGAPLAELSPQLNRRLQHWRQAEPVSVRPFRQDDHLPDITSHFRLLHNDKPGVTAARSAADALIFLEDSAQVEQRLQQLKLAALGRLTASIAHEIRNPLASISHAAQLLMEATGGDSHQRLGKIIHDNTKRADKIIANVLDVSRRKHAKPEELALQSWLETFCRDFSRGYGELKPQWDIQVQPATLCVWFDSGHLHQVLWNLCTNACLHGAPDNQPPQVRLQAGVDERRARPYLDVIDTGPGIPDSEVRKIFEPFFTTQSGGTGLGLYIARELCEANHAELQYIRPETQGSCFRITFASTASQERKQRWIAATS